MLLEHIEWTIKNTVVEHLDIDEARDLFDATIYWIDCWVEISIDGKDSGEVEDFQSQVLDRVLELEDSLS